MCSSPLICVHATKMAFLIDILFLNIRQSLELSSCAVFGFCLPIFLCVLSCGGNFFVRRLVLWQDLCDITVLISTVPLKRARCTAPHLSLFSRN